MRIRVRGLREDRHMKQALRSLISQYHQANESRIGKRGKRYNQGNSSHHRRCKRLHTAGAGFSETCKYSPQR